MNSSPSSSPLPRLRLLDLFCGAGGAAKGYADAGFDVVGVDIEPQPSYPFEFIKADAIEVLKDVVFLATFDALHASPPCQRYSAVTHRSGRGNPDDWPDLIGPVRDLLEASGLPWVIENVPLAPLRDPILLCGTMFPPLRVIRHRIFESNVLLRRLPHLRHPPVFTYDKRSKNYGKLDGETSFVSVVGNGQSRLSVAQEAMGIDWMSRSDLSEAVPPAYTEYIGREVAGRIAVQEETAA